MKQKRILMCGGGIIKKLDAVMTKRTGTMPLHVSTGKRLRRRPF